VKTPKKPPKQAPASGRYTWHLVLTILVVVLNLNTLSNGFTLDDRTLVVEDPRVKDLERVPELLLGGYRHGWENSLYRPFTSLTLAFNYAVSGPSAWGFHVLNLLLHMGASSSSSWG
jgi:hypothetical protein